MGGPVGQCAPCSPTMGWWDRQGSSRDVGCCGRSAE
jgi:hypothetical protein